MRALIIFVAAIVMVAGLVSRISSQDLGSPGNTSMRPNLALIDDTKARLGTSQAEGVGRYSITMLDSNAILLDSATGNTWQLTSREENGKPVFRWTPISRVDRAHSVPKKRSKQPKENQDSDVMNPFSE